MKLDKDTWAILYGLAAFGVIASIVLDRFAGIRFVYTIWATVPAFMLAGGLFFRWMGRRTDEAIRKANTPTAIKEVPGLGEFRQLPEWWETTLRMGEPGAEAPAISVTLDAGDDGPSERQVRLLGELRSRFAELMPVVRDALKPCCDPKAPREFQAIDFSDPAVHVFADGDPHDFEISFGVADERSDMMYAVGFKDWRVVDAYGAD